MATVMDVCFRSAFNEMPSVVVFLLHRCYVVSDYIPSFMDSVTYFTR